MHRSKETLIDTVDIFGTPVYLLKDTWETKIINDHPQMAGMEKTVKKALENPDNVYKDSDFDSTHNYYYEHKSIKLKGFGKHLKVSVDKELGRVKSAYTLNKYGNEGEKIYPKGTNENEV